MPNSRTTTSTATRRLTDPSAEADSHRPTHAPDWYLKLGESRALFELGGFLAASPILRLLGRGDRHPVLVLPGFTAGDSSTVPLRWTIRSQGYWAHGWRLGPNLGPTEQILDGIRARLTQLHERHGGKVSLIGWSLGGIYARELARSHPDCVRQVITLGSPFRLTTADRSTVSLLVDRLSPAWSSEVMRLAMEEFDKPRLTVPSTAIYTREDGVVRWHACIDEVTDLHENIEVIGSHSGLGFNPAVHVAVSDRLQQSEHNWTPFKAPLPLRPLFPTPESWDGEKNRKPQRRSTSPTSRTSAIRPPAKSSAKTKASV